MGKTLLANLAKVALSNAGPRMTPWAVTATIAKRSTARGTPSLAALA